MQPIRSRAPRPGERHHELHSSDEVHVQQSRVVIDVRTGRKEVKNELTRINRTRIRCVVLKTKRWLKIAAVKLSSQDC